MSDIKALFPSDSEPFYAGYGNRINVSSLYIFSDQLNINKLSFITRMFGRIELSVYQNTEYSPLIPREN